MSQGSLPNRDATPRPPEPHRICGSAAVRAVFLRRPEQVLRLFYTAERRRIAGPLCAHLARTRRPYREVEGEELARIAGTPHHGGICAVTAPRRALTLPGPALPADLSPARLLPLLDGDDSSGAHFLKKIKKRARPLSPFIHHTLNSYVPFAGKVKKESSAAKKVGFFDERDERVQE